MRLLHARDDPLRGAASGTAARTGARGNPPLHERQYLPVRHLRADRDRHRAGRQGHERGRPMNEAWQPTLAWDPESEPGFEVERYEIDEGSASWEVSRRHFFQIVGSGIVVALLLPKAIQAQPPAQRGRRGFGASLPQEIGAWLHIGEDSRVTVYTGKV